MAKCKAKEGCEKEAIKVGLCNTHYVQVQRGARSYDGTLLRPLRPRYKGVHCKFEDCKRKVLAKGFCSKHWGPYHSFLFQSGFFDFHFSKILFHSQYSNHCQSNIYSSLYHHCLSNGFSHVYSSDDFLDKAEFSCKGAIV